METEEDIPILKNPVADKRRNDPYEEDQKNNEKRNKRMPTTKNEKSRKRPERKMRIENEANAEIIAETKDHGERIRQDSQKKEKRMQTRKSIRQLEKKREI